MELEFVDRIRQITSQINRQVEHIDTEEATKNALVMPFINALGYNVFDPTEVIPEYTADVGTKRGEKVDYAIMQNGKPIILIECKHVDQNLRKAHSSQLFRYFTVTDVRFAILTNGIEYHFFSDLENKNRMDERPFLVINMTSLEDRHIEELKRFSKSSFDESDILSTASDLKYRREIGQVIAAEFKEPSEVLVRHLAGHVFDGRFTQNVVDDFRVIVKEAIRLHINKQINKRLKTALGNEDTDLNGTDSQEIAAVSNDKPSEEPESESEKNERQIITTALELEGYYIVKTILREQIDAKRVSMRDTLSYCGILLDDNNRKPICRLHFNRAQMYLGVFDANKKEERIIIEDVDEIYNYRDRLFATVEAYDS
jgi:hypothetical protein